MKLLDTYKGLRKELYILFIGKMMTNMGSMVFPMITMILNQKLGFDASTIATFMILYMLLNLPVALFSGRLADHFSKKNIIVVCDFVSVVFYLLCAFLPFSFFTIVLLCIASLFQSAERSAYDTLIADFTLPKDREKAYSLSYMGANLGLVLSPTIGGLLFKNYLWLCFAINGLSIFLSTILILFGIKDTSRSRSEDDLNIYEEDADDSASALKIIKENRVLCLYLVFMILYETVYSQFSTLVPLDLARSHPDTGAAIYGTLSSVNCIIVVIFTPILTKLLENRKEIFRLQSSVLAVVLGYVIFLSFTPVLMSYLAMTVFTMGEILNSIGSHPYLSRRIPASHRGRITSILWVTTSVCVSLFQKVISKQWDIAASRAWTIVFSLSGLAFGVLVILYFLDRKKYRDLY